MTSKLLNTSVYRNVKFSKCKTSESMTISDVSCAKEGFFHSVIFCLGLPIVILNGSHICLPWKVRGSRTKRRRKRRKGKEREKKEECAAAHSFYNFGQAVCLFIK